MILTVTPSPSVDRTILVDHLQRGQVIRARRAWSEPSGKGINVALALHRSGVEVEAVVPLGGRLGTQLARMLDDAGLRVHPVQVGGEIRSNVSLVEPDGTVTKINEPGPELGAAEVAALLATVGAHLGGVTWLACCGSLPVGAPADLYARLAELGRAAGARVAVDSSGEPLRACLDGRPDLVKPNVPELGALVGRPLATIGDAVDAAEHVRGLGAAAVLASLGPDGVLLADSSGVAHAEAPVAVVRSAVGAGDAALAGYLGAGQLDLGGGRLDALRAAAAWGATAVGHEGTLFPGVDRDQQVLVRVPVDRTRRLLEPVPG